MSSGRVYNVGANGALVKEYERKVTSVELETVKLSKLNEWTQ